MPQVQKVRLDCKISQSRATAVANRDRLIRKEKIIKNEIRQQPIKRWQLLTNRHSWESHLGEWTLTKKQTGTTAHTAITASPQKGRCDIYKTLLMLSIHLFFSFSIFIGDIEKK